MSKITRQDSDGVKPLLSTGELGYDNYPAGGDVGRVYVGTGSANIAQAKKSEVDSAVSTTNAHIGSVNNPHAVTKAQVGLSNADNTSDNVKNVLSATKWTAARTITLSGDVTGSVSVDGSANVTMSTTIQPNSVALGTDTTGNYMVGIIAGSGLSVSHTQGEGSTATITNSAPNVTTDITTTHNSTNVVVNSSDGTDGTINAATQTLAGVMSAADKTKLDGMIGASGEQTASEILTLLKTVDGSGSGIDADLLDGQEGAYYLNASNLNSGTVNAARLPATITSSTTGNAATATTLATARTINGVSFNGSANITISDSTKVALTGNETIAGIKTFSSSPIVPTPTTDTQAVNKAYADSKYSGFKNYIINGGFDIDQRNNKAGFIIAAGSYAFSADRWIINNTTNQPVSITVADFPTPSGGRVGRLRIKFDTAPTSGVIQIFQRIENVSILGGKQVTLAHSFDCDAMTITNDATQNFGSGGSSNVATSFSNIYTTGILSSLTRFSSSITLPSVAGKTIGTGSYTQIAYSLPIRTTNIQTITQVQLEEGSVATPFEQRPYGLELSLCQRYYEVCTSHIIGNAHSTNSYLSTTINFAVVKRVIPSIVYSHIYQSSNIAVYSTVSVTTGGCVEYIISDTTTLAEHSGTIAISAEL